MEGEKMTQSIVVYMKDGSVKDFPHSDLDGGNYAKTIRYEGGFAIITETTDKFYDETAIPSQGIVEIKRREHK